MSQSGFLGVLRWSSWGQEFFAIFGASLSLAVISILLAKFDGQPVFEQNGVTLNTLVSIFSVISKAAIALVLSVCLSQWKWILFARYEGPLINFDRLDRATRGPLGSLKVAIRTRATPIVKVGAMLTIFAFTLDPFSQQLIHVNQGIMFEDGKAGISALISRSTSYQLGEVFDSNTTTDITDAATSNLSSSLQPSMEGAISIAFWKSLNEVRQEVLFQCPTWDCKFDAFETLAMCSRCNNITTNITKARGNFDGTMNEMQGYRTGAQDNSSLYASAYSLPNGHFIANTDGCHPYRKSDRDCNGGGYQTTSFATGNPNKTAAPPDEERSLQFHPNWSAGHHNPLYILGPPPVLFSVAANAIKSLSAHFQQRLIWAPWRDDPRIRKELRRIKSMENAVGFNGAIVTSHQPYPHDLGRLLPNPKDGFQSVSAVFEVLAESMTNEMRRVSSEEDVASRGLRTMRQKGVTGTVVVLYQVNWQWIAVHVILLLLTFLFLLFTMMRSGEHSEIPLWKNSSLGALRHGYDMGGLLPSGMASVKELENAAREMCICGGHEVDGGVTYDDSAESGGLEGARMPHDHLKTETLPARGFDAT
ncbi:hypothetical protein CNYM01_01320 [Colletotrichum nymphaeae SA-01]|uniref:Uncharacterized protein n=1 Tax=Colletotrichum nymphaeae SA-01 TaxID=1460502 RepID=A0A135SNH2_9PEZI|nr:hypothetical protein CNYM01_01320 [Colletotrichum nymphaeae SA-01]